ncbi:MAG: VOC family protein [Nitrososphaerales archaeon]
MPPTLSNGKVCYIEIPSTDIRRSADFYKEVFGGGSGNAATATLLSMIRPVK